MQIKINHYISKEMAGFGLFNIVRTHKRVSARAITGEVTRYIERAIDGRFRIYSDEWDEMPRAIKNLWIDRALDLYKRSTVSVLSSRYK